MDTHIVIQSKTLISQDIAFIIHFTFTGSQMSDEASSDPSIIIQSEDLDGEQVRHQYLV